MESFTMQYQHRKAESRKESENTPYLNAVGGYLLVNQNS